MTDKEQQNPQPPRRHTNANRARHGHNRIYQHLGVRDLREIIDRKRTERGHPNETSIPPPDPSYNYLKDPLRESVEQNVQDPSKQNNTRKHKNYPSNSPKRDNHKGQTSPQVKCQQDIENPLNIKVEFSTSTGEHSYKFDESIVLPTIKHVPDHTTPAPNRSFRRRGRSRGRGPRSYQTRTIRNNKRQVPIQVSVATEENWDNDLYAAKAVSEHKCPVSKDCDICDNNEESYEEVHDKIDQQTEGEVGLEKQVENLKLVEDDNLTLKEKREEAALHN